MRVPTAGKFTINGGDSAFASRQKQLFDQLSQAEKECHKDQQSAIEVNDIIESNTCSRPPPPGKRRKSETRQFRGKESIFKRPALPSPFTDRSMPDHRRNPHKWLKYSLDDVKNDDMSEKTNTTTALSFLSELRARKSINKIYDETRMKLECPNRISTGLTICPSSSTPTICFTKPPNKQINKGSSHIIVDQNEKVIFRGSKVILPEYVVGQKPIDKKKQEKSKIVKVDRHNQLKLNHLEEFDDGE